nr:low molecular weight protein-tyrosine-phosphatase [Roseateles toxinivorans]
MTQVLLVCMANVCRSPMAKVTCEAIAGTLLPRPTGLRALLKRKALCFDSAGAKAGLGRAQADARAQKALKGRGYGPAKQRARRVTTSDFIHCDLILAMDSAVLSDLQQQCPAVHQHKLHLFLDFTPELRGQDVPDPYFGDAAGFAHALSLCETGAQHLVRALIQGEVPGVRLKTN